MSLFESYKADRERDELLSEIASLSVKIDFHLRRIRSSENRPAAMDTLTRLSALHAFSARIVREMKGELPKPK